MLIKDRNKNTPLIPKAKNIITGLWRQKQIIFILLYSFLLIFAGAAIQRSGVFGNVIKPALLYGTQIARDYLIGLTARPERITININYKNFQKLAYARETALKRGWEYRNFEYVPATIDYKDKSIPVRIRLKGDRAIHYQDRYKWSFRVNTRGDNTLFGMKRFSLHRPEARNYIYEWIFHEALRREGLIPLRYMFVNVTLNGRDLGIYALEEHFGKHLIENNRLREGPIIKFNEDHGENINLMPIDCFEEDKWSSPERVSQLKKAVNLLEAFRRGDMKISEVFDTGKLATFFAITDLFGMNHAAIPKSMRFYYNPMTARLEPIGFDGHFKEDRSCNLSAEFGINPAATWLYGLYGGWFRLIFNNKDTFDETFFEEYVKVLDRISKASYLDSFFTDINNALNHNLAILYRESPLFADHTDWFGPDLFTFSKKFFYERQNYIKTLLGPKRTICANYKMSTPGYIVLEIGNIGVMPVEIVNATYKDNTLLVPDRREILLPQSPLQVPDYREIYFKIPEGITRPDTIMAADLKVANRVLGMKEPQYTTVYPWPHINMDSIRDDLARQAPNMQEFDFILVEEPAKKIFIKPGEWNLSKSLNIPKGYTVICSAGTRLNLSNSSKIFSLSPFNFSASEENPIFISSPDSSGQGIVVIDADKTSLLNDVIFDNLSNPSQNGWELTGAVTFYQSPVEIRHCQFANNRSEDALNIVRSDFAVDKALFKNILRDAFDSDFSAGSISDSFFTECGNDAVDISGSVVELSNVAIDGAGDKGLSVGERSSMKAESVSIKNANLAMASKDESELFIRNVKISDCKVGASVYQKKPEFGPGSMDISELTMDNVETMYSVEEGSDLRVNGKKIQPSRKDAT